MINIKEILLSISIALDHANGRKPEFSLKLALVSVFLAKLSHCSKEQIELVYLSSIMKSIGCTSYSPDEAKIFSGDDISFKSAFSTVDSINHLDMLSHMRKLKTGNQWDELKMKFRLILDGKTLYKKIIEAHCDSARILIQEIQLNPEISLIINDFYERYDGKGIPHRKKKDEIHFATRIISAAQYFISLSEVMDIKKIDKKLKAASGRMFDPEIVDLLSIFLDELYILMNSETIYDDALSISPNIYVKHLNSVALLISYLPDFKSRYTPTHSKKVSELALYLAKSMKLSEEEQSKIYISALIMNIGMVCIPSGILEKKSTLNSSEKEIIETHTYHTYQILKKSKILNPYLDYCISHHETLLGTGYHRRIKDLNLSQSILIYADKVIALSSERSYRKAFTKQEILKILKAETQDGKLEKSIFPHLEKYFGIKNKKSPYKKNLYSLTEREIEVLRLIAEGNTNKQIGNLLEISSRTVQHHTIHIYEKMGVKSRSAAIILGFKEKIIKV